MMGPYSTKKAAFVGKRNKCVCLAYDSPVGWGFLKF